MLTKEEFLMYYDRYGKFPGGISCKGPGAYNEIELETKYKKYVNNENRKRSKKDLYFQQKREEFQFYIENGFPEKEQDERWIEMREAVYFRDNNECQLFKCLSSEEKEVYYKHIGPQWLRVLNPAHIFKVGQYPHIKYKGEYVVTMNQISHGLLDAGKCPLTGNLITPEEIEYWWIRIVGKKDYYELKGALNG